MVLWDMYLGFGGVHCAFGMHEHVFGGRQHQCDGEHLVDQQQDHDVFKRSLTRSYAYSRECSKEKNSCVSFYPAHWPVD